MLDSINSSTFRIFAGVFGVAALSMTPWFSFDRGADLDEQHDLGSFNIMWEAPSALSSDWPLVTTCSTDYTAEDRQRAYARAQLVLRATELLASRLREVSGVLHANSAALAVILPAVVSLEAPFVQLRSMFKSSDVELRCLENAGSDEELVGLLQGLQNARSTSRSRFLELVLAARRSAEHAEATMVHNERETLADSYTFAVSSSIQRLESVAIAEVDDSPDAHFEVGMLLSEVFVIGRSRETLVKAEELLRKGEELSTPTQRQFHALARAERLYEHGQVLATEWDLDHEVAGSRYRNAVKITLGQQKFQEGARYLARYAHFLSDHGLLEEALNTANKAVELDKADSEPLARYLQISLSQRLGELRTPAQIRSAEVQLDNIAGKLSAWPEAEASRTSLREELDRWHAVSKAGSTGSDWFGRVLDVGRACVQHGDAAKLTLCLLCKGILPASA